MNTSDDDDDLHQDNMHDSQDHEAYYDSSSEDSHDSK
jgi:hypothetical protein